MEYLVPIVVVTIAMGLLLLILRRPTVVRPPGDDTAQKAVPPRGAATSDDPMNEIPDLNIDMMLGGRRITLKGNKTTGWTLMRGLDQTTVSPELLRSVVLKRTGGPLTMDLLAKLAPGSLPRDAP